MTTTPAQDQAPSANAVIPGRPRTRHYYDPTDVEAALCAWEHMVENSENEVYNRLFDNYGRGAMRACAVQAGLIAEATYKQMTASGYELNLSYDIDFVPLVLDMLDWDLLIEDNQCNGAAYLPDTAALFAAVLEANPHPFRKVDRREEWMARATQECIKQWQYAGLISDHQDRTDAAFEAGEDPATFVSELGEKYGLTPASSW